MNRKNVFIFCLLLVAYFSYTCLVYSNCDNKHNLSPDNHILAGWKLWQEKNCQGCHQLYGLGGYLGPDLTNIASDSTKGINYAKAFIQNGTMRMPNFNLTDEEVNNIAQFLSWVDKSGHSRITSDKVNWNGNYNIEN